MMKDGRIWSAGICALAALLLSSAASAQEDPLLSLRDKARAYRVEIQRHRDPRWLPQFLEAFLGKNHAQATPELSDALRRIAGAPAGEKSISALKKFSGDAAPLAEVLELATREAKVWEPGRVVRQETVNRLWSLVYRGPPEPGAVPRIEAYEAPPELRRWLIEEQVVNDKIMRDPSGAARGTLPVELDPPSRPLYWLPHVEIPVEEARILEAGGLQKGIAGQLVFSREGRTFVRYFIHPGSFGSPSLQKLIQKYPLRIEYLATPTSSPRSLAAWNPYTGGKFFLVKASLAATVGGLRRVNKTDKGLRAVTTTRALDAYYRKVRTGRSPPYMREPMVVFPKGSDFGMIVREAPDAFPNSKTGRYVPGSSIVSSRPDGSDPLLVEMVKKSGEAPLKYVSERLLTPLLRQYAEITLRQGLVGEPHQQNVLVEIGKDGHLTGRFVFRDLDSYKVDVEQRLRNGLTVRGLFSFADPSMVGDLRLRKARVYYGDSYLWYVRDDWGYMLGKGLKKYFPELEVRDVYREIDRIFAKEVRRILGVEMRLERQLPDPNSVLEEYRERKAAEPPPPRDPRVTDAMLHQEVQRLETNRRVMWVGGKTSPSRQHTFVLHEGVIEMRLGTKVVAFAFLEPIGTGDFYKDVPHRRIRPDPARLALLYEAAAPKVGGQQERASGAPRLQVVRMEAMGAGTFAAAFVIKEAISSLEEGDPARLIAAGGALTKPEFYGVLAMFSGIGHGIGRLLDTKRMGAAIEKTLPKAARALPRMWLPLVAAIPAVEVAMGERDAGKIARTTAVYTAIGAALDLPVILGMIAVPGPGTAFGFAYFTAKLVFLLWAGEKIDAWIAGLPGPKEAPMAAKQDSESTSSTGSVGEGPAGRRAQPEIGRRNVRP